MSSDRLAKRLAVRLFLACRDDPQAGVKLRNHGFYDWISSDHAKSENPVTIACDAFLYLMEEENRSWAGRLLVGILAFLEENGYPHPTEELGELAKLLDKTPFDPNSVSNWFRRAF